EDLGLSVLYLPQLIGLALGLSEQDLKLNLNFAYSKTLQQKINSIALDLKPNAVDLKDGNDQQAAA
ncbi:MAG: hypothetical protein RBS57_15600, partial [Desulforhabdus sp.]|nr:hypothetical protein [Desulforhabdus sp.]